MTDEAQIQRHRKARLRELIDHFFGARIVELAHLIDKDSNYVSRMLYPVGKAQWRPVSDKMARLIVQATKIDPDWFEQPEGHGIPGVTAELAATPHVAQPLSQQDVATVAIVWPFRLVAYQRLLALQKQLGKRRGAEALRDIDAQLDVTVTKWENEARRSAGARAA